jgi:hypothetical protein
MAETKRPAALNFYQGADGPTLMFLINEDADFLGLRAVFLHLAQGEAGNVSLRAAGIVEIASAIDDLVFVRLLDQHEPSRMVRKVRDTLRGPLFEFADTRRAGLNVPSWLRVSGAPVINTLAFALAASGPSLTFRQDALGRNHHHSFNNEKANIRRKIMFAFCSPWW